MPFSKIFQLYHIFRLKYRCFVYALSLIVLSLYRAYPISHTLYRTPKKFQNFKIFQNFTKIFKKLKYFIKYQNFQKFSYNTGIIKGMVEIYDIMNITCQNLYHMLYQPSIYITPWCDIGFLG